MISITTRNIRPSELDEVVRVEAEAWPLEIQAPREKFESRMKLFPKGSFGVYANLKLVGVTTSEIVRYDPQAHFTWEDITDNGWIRGTHNPMGNTLYVVSVGASQADYMVSIREELKKRGEPGVGTRLVEAQKELTARLALQRLVLGARIPNYHKYSDMTPEEYLKMTNEKGEPYEAEIRFYARCGLKPVKVVANYMEDDPESMNYGVVMEWKPNGR